MKARSILGIVIALFLLQNASAQIEFTPDSVKSVCKRVGKARLSSKLYNGWQFATFFEGAMALYDLTNDKQYLDSIVGWGTYSKWLSAYNNPTATPEQDTFPVSFDDVCCYQVYLETYMADPQPANLPHIKAALSYIKRFTYETCPNTCKDVFWPIVDQYHMAAPIYARAAVILSDPIMFDTVYHFAVQDARHHYNVKYHLWNSNCSDTNTTRQWWSRGCGWGVCGTCRLHQYMPIGHPGRTWCEQRIRETSAKLITLQNQTDGMWRSELFTPTMQKEASGTGFFCYQLFYGMRRGILDTATYMGPAKKAWKGLLGCIGVDAANPNIIGFSQAIGGAPSDNFGANSHNEYTDGAFLMAGNEFYKLLTAGVTRTISQDAHVNTMHEPHPSIRTLCAIGANSSVRMPDEATGFELYSLSGRKIAASKMTRGSQRLVTLPANGTGVTIVKFMYNK